MTEAHMSTAPYDDLQCAPDFRSIGQRRSRPMVPLLGVNREHLGQGRAFAMDRDVPVGSIVDFTILLPAEVVGARQIVPIDYRRYVVRIFDDRGRRGVRGCD